MKETWKFCKGYEGLYRISNFGSVFSVRNNRLLSARNVRGYLSVSLCKNGNEKHFYIHRLVAEAFISNPNDWPEVNHKDGDKANNCVNNLEWCTRKYNSKHAHVVLKSFKRTSKRGRVLCVETGDVFESTQDVGRKTNISGAAVRMTLCGKNQTCAGYHWEYTDREPTKIDASKYKYKVGTKRRMAKSFGISPELLWWRLHNGWTLNEIKNTPPDLGNRYKRKHDA